MLKMLATATLAVLSLSACCASSAQLVRKDATGGRVALQGAYMPAMEDAQMLMVDHCGGRFAVLEHGDYVDFRCNKPTARVEAQLAQAEVGAVK